MAKSNSFYYFLNSPSFDWVAILALIVAIISIGIAIYYNRKTLQLTEAHNKKSVEPLITDLYTPDIIIEKGKNSSVSYQIRNCGLGPAIIKSYNFRINEKNFKHAFEIYEQNLGKPKYIYDLSTIFIIEQSHIIASNESLFLFDLYFINLETAAQFHELVRKIAVSLEYETIYGEKRFFKKERLSRI